MASIASWIYDKPLRGNYTFTHDEVAQAFPDMSAGSIARALTRVVSKGRIMSPLRGFYVIVPDEYVLRGAVPQSFYLDDMVHQLGRKYYVALLSAASYHGASHQVPLRFSVMIEPPAETTMKKTAPTMTAPKIPIPTLNRLDMDGGQYFRVFRYSTNIPQTITANRNTFENVCSFAK